MSEGCHEEIIIVTAISVLLTRRHFGKAWCAVRSGYIVYREA